jgi:hypothetical protein
MTNVLRKVSLSFKLHGGLITGAYLSEVGPEKECSLLADTLNPLIPGYEKSEMVPFDRSEKNGCVCEKS